MRTQKSTAQQSSKLTAMKEDKFIEARDQFLEGRDFCLRYLQTKFQPAVAITRLIKMSTGEARMYGPTFLEQFTKYRIQYKIMNYIRRHPDA